MKKYRVITDGIRYRVQRMLLGLIPITEKDYTDYEGEVESEPKNFFSKEEALLYIRNKVKPAPKPRNRWVVAWNGYKGYRP